MRRDWRVWVWRIAGWYDMLGGFDFLIPQTYTVNRPPTFCFSFFIFSCFRYEGSALVVGDGLVNLLGGI